MSLRQRFLVMLLLAVVGIGGAGLAGFHLRAESSTVRERQAFEEADRAVEDLAGRAETRVALEPGWDPAELETDNALADLATQVLASVFESSGGYCDADGSLLVAVKGASRFDWPEPVDPRPRSRPALLPADRDALIAACRAAKSGRIDHKRVSLPHDLLMYSLRGATNGLVAWVIVRLPPAGTHGLGIDLFLEATMVALATLAFVVVALGALVALRRGAADLDTGLAMLQTDLRAQIPLPRIGELKRVAAGLRQMANHLAETQDRERVLAAELVHEQRLGSLGRMAAGVAHEVRNPLAGIKLTLDNMARRKLDERSAQDVATCREEIGRIDRVVSSLLLVARKGSLEASTFDAAKLVDERIAIAAGLAATRGVHLVRDGNISITANGDALVRVIDNLLRNGIEASPPSAEVRIELRQSGRDARIRFIDRGGGVPEGRLGELFEPFFTLKPEGTGLGLFLSRSLLEAHGGTLTYDREDGLTCFCATMPTDSAICRSHHAS